MRGGGGSYGRDDYRDSRGPPQFGGPPRGLVILNLISSKYVLHFSSRVKNITLHYS